jgi:hypothetical protein
LNATLRRDGHLDREAVMRAPGLELTVVGEDSSNLAAAGEHDRRVEMDRVERPDLDGSSCDARSRTVWSMSSKLVCSSTRAAAASKPSRRASRRSSTISSLLDHQASYLARASRISSASGSPSSTRPSADVST